MTKTREQQLERQLKLMEYVDAMYEAAEDRGLYMDHSSEIWERNGNIESRPMTFFIWDATNSISTFFKAPYAHKTYKDIKIIASRILDEAIQQAFE